MKRLAIILTVIFLTLASSAWASSRSCNVTLVNQNVCRDSGNLVLFYDAPGAAFADLRDAIAAEYNYQPEIVCAPSRQFEALLNGQPSKVMSAAGVAEGDCSTVGQPTANPQGAAEFADAQIDMEMRNRVIAWKHNMAQQEADDPTSIPTPDVGGE